jgi:hypothetical protein
LNRKTGARIGFEHDRAALGVEHEIHTEIIQFQHTGEFRRRDEQFIPTRHGDTGNRRARVGMKFDRPVFIDAAECRARFQVNAGSDGALMQVRPAARRVRITGNTFIESGNLPWHGWKRQPEKYGVPVAIYAGEKIEQTDNKTVRTGPYALKQ